MVVQNYKYIEEKNNRLALILLKRIRKMEQKVDFEGKYE